MLDALTLPDALQDIGFFALALFRQKHADRFSDRLRRRIAIDMLGTGIPGENDAIQILTDDGVFGRLDDGS